jgi:hypothetical protein
VRHGYVAHVAEEFTRRRLTGARFDDVDLSGASFHRVDLRRARFHEVDLSGARLRATLLRDVDIGGDIDGLRVNGVDVGPLIEAELDRRYPERRALRPTDAAGYRDAWTVIERLWAATVERARRLDPVMLHERVDDEWSFIETLRHLVFATDCWVRRVLLGEPAPWDALDLPWDEMPDTPGVPRDRTARPSLDEVLALRADRMASVRDYVDGLTDDRLASETEPVDAPGWPPPLSFVVHDVLDNVLNEEWWHRHFAERDLAILTARC